MEWSNACLYFWFGSFIVEPASSTRWESLAEAALNGLLDRPTRVSAMEVVRRYSKIPCVLFCWQWKSWTALRLFDTKELASQVLEEKCHIWPKESLLPKVQVTYCSSSMLKCTVGVLWFIKVVSKYFIIFLGPHHCKLIRSHSCIIFNRTFQKLFKCERNIGYIWKGRKLWKWM